MTKSHEQIARVADKLFDTLSDVAIEVALEALAQVIKEFERAAKDEPIPSRFRERADS